MKPSPLLWILTLVFVSMQPQVRAAASADAAWKKLQYAMSSMEPEKFERQSREQILERTRVGLRRFDAAMQEFLAAAPHDPRLWEAKVFDVVRLSSSRRSVRYPAPSEEEGMKVVEEALAAPDAPTAAKAMASAYKLRQLARDTWDGKFARDEWVRMAEAHLKDYPGKNGDNERIESWKAEMRTTVDLMALPPIDLKLTSTDGTEVDLAKLRGKVVLLFFWTVWKDDGVARMAPIVRDTYQKHHANGFEVIGIPFDADTSTVTRVLRQNPTPWPQIIDPQSRKMIATRYKMTQMSRTTLFLFDKKGMLVRPYVRETLPEDVEKLLME